MAHFSVLPGFLRCLSAFGLLLLAVLTAPPAMAQTPDWRQAVVLNPGSYSICYVMAAQPGAAGEVYVAGEFDGTARFGSTTLTSGGAGVFVAKWSRATGDFVWAKQVRGGGLRFGGLAVRGAEIFVSGSFSEAVAALDSYYLTNANTNLTIPRSNDVFVGKLLDAGTSASFVWAKGAGSTSDDYAGGVAVAGNSVYLTGTFTGFNTSFGTITVTNPTGGNNVNLFVSKLTDAGTTAAWTWAKGTGGPNGAGGGQIAAQGNKVYVAGGFAGTTALIGSTTLTNAGTLSVNNNDGFVACLTDTGPTGTFDWATQVGGPYTDEIRALVVRGTSIYLAGYFTGSASFGSHTLTSPVSANGNGYVAKLTDTGTTGSFAWAQRLGNTGQDIAQTLVVNGTSLYVGGHFGSPTLTLGATTLTNPSPNQTAIYIAQLTDTGTAATVGWARQSGSGTSNYLRALAQDADGTLYAAGVVTAPSTLGPIRLTNPPAPYAGYLATLSTTALAVATQSLSPSVTLAPNPAHGTVAVQVPAAMGTGVLTLALLNALGQTLRTQTTALPATGTTLPLDVAGLPCGVYTVRLTVGGSTATKRLVLE